MPIPQESAYMTTAPQESNNYLSDTDDTELDKFVTTLELSDGATIIFAIAPDSSPQHPVMEQFKTFSMAITLYIIFSTA